MWHKGLKKKVNFKLMKNRFDTKVPFKDDTEQEHLFS